MVIWCYSSEAAWNSDTINFSGFTDSLGLTYFMQAQLIHFFQVKKY